ncbi:MAG: polysaccharide export protein [Nitrospira sp.]|nr:polysaccharide export protein [Nitrospira sp.]
MRRIRYTCWAVCFMVLCLAAAVQASETEPVAVPSPEAGWSGPFRLGAGDVLNVFIWKHKELSTMVTVRPDGKINYPLIGEIEAKGLTLGEIEERINKQLKQHIQDPQVTVILEATHSFRIFVLGEVMQPGVFDLKGPVTVIQALAMARGSPRLPLETRFSSSIPLAATSSGFRSVTASLFKEKIRIKM